MKLSEMLLKSYVNGMKELLNILCVTYQAVEIVDVILLHKVVKLQVAILWGILRAAQFF